MKGRHHCVCSAVFQPDFTEPPLCGNAARLFSAPYTVKIIPPTFDLVKAFFPDTPPEPTGLATHDSPTEKARSLPAPFSRKPLDKSPAFHGVRRLSRRFLYQTKGVHKAFPWAKGPAGQWIPHIFPRCRETDIPADPFEPAPHPQEWSVLG